MHIIFLIIDLTVHALFDLRDYRLNISQLREGKDFSGVGNFLMKMN